MKAEILDSASSASTTEMNFREPIRPSSPRARRWTTSIAVSLGLLGLAASFAIAVLSLRSHASPSSVPTTSALTDDMRWYSLAYVDTEPGITALYPSQLGRVEKVVVRENESVKAGQPLFYLDNSVQLIMVREAEADLEGARSKLTIAEAGVEEATKQIEAQKIAIAAAPERVKLARIYRDKQKGLVEKTLVSEEMLKTAEIAVKQAESGLKGEQAKLPFMEAAKHKAEGYVAAAQALIKAKQAQLDKAQKAISECVVRAPDDGTPLRINVAKGETLGSNPRRAAIEFKADRPLLVRAEVGQEFVDRVHSGQKVIILDHVTGKECAHGKVASIAQWYAPRRSTNPELLGMNNDDRTLECIIDIESTLQEIRMGQRVRVQFRN